MLAQPTCGSAGPAAAPLLGGLCRPSALSDYRTGFVNRLPRPRSRRHYGWRPGSRRRRARVGNSPPRPPPPAREPPHLVLRPTHFIMYRRDVAVPCTICLGPRQPFDRPNRQPRVGPLNRRQCRTGFRTFDEGLLFRALSISDRAPEPGFRPGGMASLGLIRLRARPSPKSKLSARRGRSYSRKIGYKKGLKNPVNSPTSAGSAGRAGARSGA